MNVSPISTRHRFVLIRIVLGMLAVTVPVVLTLFLAQCLVPEPLRGYWPQLLAALLCVAGYRLYMHRVERRAMGAFSGECATRELGAGTLLGGGLFLAVMGMLAATDAYQVKGSRGAVLVPLSGMILVALFEETLFRGILFRNLERTLGSWAALPVSALLFGLAHLPNANAGLIAIGATVIAGLWPVVGMHFAWNTMSDALFSMTTSGHSAKGFLQGRLSSSE